MKKTLGGGGFYKLATEVDIDKLVEQIDEVSAPHLDKNNAEGVKARARTIYYEAMRVILREIKRPIEPEDFVIGIGSALAHILYTISASAHKPGTDMERNIWELGKLIADMAIETMRAEEAGDESSAYH